MHQGCDPPSVPTSWDDVVQSMVLESMVLESSVWCPRSLHTAQATGSKPVTPTRRCRGPAGARLARRPDRSGQAPLGVRFCDLEGERQSEVTAWMTRAAISGVVCHRPASLGPRAS